MVYGTATCRVAHRIIDVIVVHVLYKCEARLWGWGVASEDDVVRVNPEAELLPGGLLRLHRGRDRRRRDGCDD